MDQCKQYNLHAACNVIYACEIHHGMRKHSLILVFVNSRGFYYTWNLVLTVIQTLATKTDSVPHPKALELMHRLL